MPVIKLPKKPVTPGFDAKRELCEIKNLLYVTVIMLLALFAFFVGVLMKYVVK